MSAPTETPLEVGAASPEDKKKSCCSLFDGNNDAKGYAYLGAARGTIVMANIFLFQSLLSLANEAAGCDGSSVCENEVYGMRPSSWVSNTQTFANIGASLTMPLFGAIVDYSDHRRAAGITTAAIMTAIQGIQIYTVASTWVPMLLLQAVAVVFYYAQLVSLYAYLPEMKRDVGQEKMAGFTSSFQSIQFGTQAGFLVVIAGIVFAVKSGAVLTAQISQGVNTVCVSIFLSVGWLKYLGSRKAVRELPEGHSLILEGFRTNFKTMVNIQKHFKKGIRWFFIAIAFGQAAAQSVTTLSSIYLADSLQLDSLFTSLFFLDVLVVSLLGCPIGAMVAKKTNPNISYSLAYAYIFIVLAIGLVTLTASIPLYGTFIWGGFVGIGLGWLYTVEPLYLSCLVPKGQEAEIAGFYNFCSVILGWLPTLVFSICTENNVDQQYAFMAAISFFLPGILFLMCSGKWEEIIEETASGAIGAQKNDSVEEQA